MSFPLALFVAAASGFVALSYEILWYRLCSFVTQGAPVAFGALLGFYLIGIAIGSFASRRYCASHETMDKAKTTAALGRFLFLANAVGFGVAPALGFIVTVGPWALSLGVVVLATALLGAVLPLVAHLAIPADDHAGARLSYLYIANILGSSAGSLLTGFVAMDRMTTREIAVALALLGFTLAATVLFAAEPRLTRVWRSLGGIAACGAFVFASSHAIFDQLYERLLYRKDFTPDKRFAETVENRSGLIHVSQDGRVWGGGIYDGAFNTQITDNRNWIVRAYAVSALHPRPKRMLMIGLASGSWAKVLAEAPGLEHFTIVEINPGYLGLIARHAEVAGILHDPRVDIVIDDGRRWLLSHPEESFDAIVMNTTWHWRAHSTNLLALEFFEVVKRHMNPGGLFFFNTTSSLDACETAVRAFPHTYRVINFIAGSDAPLHIDLGQWEDLLAGYRIDGQPVLDLDSEYGRDALDRLVSFAVPGTADTGVGDEAEVRSRCAAGEVVTDDNMKTEWRELVHWVRP